MTKKLVFFDIDGTLVDHDKKIPRETIEAIQTLKENDVFVAIATGRAPFMIEEIRNVLGVDSYVCFNGQYAVFEGETVYQNPIPLAELQLLNQRSQQENHSVVFQASNEMKATVKDDHFITTCMTSLKLNYPSVDPKFYHKNPIYQVLLFCEDDNQKKYEISHDQLRFVRWHDYSCDVLPNGGSKAIGVDKLIQASGVDINNTYAFGDGLNDLEMIKHVGTGVAMGNSVEELKKEADYVTDDVDNLGLVKGLKLVGLLS